MSDAELDQRIQSTNIFARAVPEQQLRRIFDDLRKAMSYLIAIHIPIAGMSLIPVLFKLPLVLLPVHVAFLHLIIGPACSIVSEAEPAEATLNS